jgi:hypothetical protein
LSTPLLIFTVSPEHNDYFNQTILNALHSALYPIKLRFDAVNTNLHTINVRHHAPGSACHALHQRTDNQRLMLT